MARLAILKCVQQEYYADELNLSKLCNLEPFVGGKGVLKVGGRLTSAPVLD